MKIKFTINHCFKSCLILIGFISFNTFSQVGIGTTTPDAQLDIVAPAAAGNALQVNDENATNISSSVLIRNLGLGRSVNINTLNTLNNVPSLSISQLGTGGFSRGLEIGMDASTTAFGLTIFQNGSAAGIYNRINGTSITGVIHDLRDHGGYGSVVELGAFNGNGYLVNAIDYTVMPGIGGDVYAFDGRVSTNTPTDYITPGPINGAVFVGVQEGEGHGIFINHQGATGRNAEFVSTNAANPNVAISAIHQGQGSAIVAQNQNNAITGQLIVADFAYTGTDADNDDHIGVSGSSTPAPYYGIGVRGTGNWVGVEGWSGGLAAVYANGDMGASGVKPFIIDHPADPANKMLKHFAIESNEVLNMYRGVEVFDGNGKAVVSLPDYYDSINKNPSYQLTPIGAAMPNLYIESEISNGQFVIAGGVPNKKVSWEITAERNDPYLQQNPEKREVVVMKTGPRKGKYFMPELYGQPKEKGISYTKQQKQIASKLRTSNNKQLETLEVVPAEQIEEETVKGKI